jgi:E3 ubiquitin-protein ligase BAH
LGAGCDGKFFGELTDELAQVVGCFNSRAQQLLQLHLASGLWKYVIRVKSSLARDPMSMIQEGQTLVNYASVNAIAVRKILKKYDKVHINCQLVA